MGRIQCNFCKDIITSTYRHDFKWCKCETVFIDGGHDYCRVGSKEGKLEEAIIHLDCADCKALEEKEGTDNEADQN